METAEADHCNFAIVRRLRRTAKISSKC